MLDLVIEKAFLWMLIFVTAVAFLLLLGLLYVVAHAVIFDPSALYTCRL